VAAILVASDDLALGSELARLLGARGHDVARVPALELGPEQGVPDVVVVDADVAGLDLVSLAAGWRDAPRPPSVVALGSSGAARVAAERVRATLVVKPLDVAALADLVARLALAPPDAGAPTAEAALRLLGLRGGGFPDDEAAAIVAGARQLDPRAVREALRGHVASYLLATPLLPRLVARRVLSSEEAALGTTLDGSRTVRGVIDSGALVAVSAARLVWALASGGAAELLREPPADVAGTAAWRTARARAHLRARHARLDSGRGSAYLVLEVPLDAKPRDLDRAVAALATRYGPDAMGRHDLGDLAPLGQAMWTQIGQAHELLADAESRGAHDAEIGVDASARMRERLERDEAEAAFVRGQRALAARDVFTAVSELAAAARRVPDEPDYEVYGAWTRVLAEAARGRAAADVAREQRRSCEPTLLGRRPRPRAAFALALIAEAAGDADGARGHLDEALACEPRFAAARQMLARL
jgi:CheY-like chemotaxis protein